VNEDSEQDTKTLLQTLVKQGPEHCVSVNLLSASHANLIVANTCEASVPIQSLFTLTNRTPSPKEVDAAWPFTRQKLAAWGVPWPPPKGWRKQLQIKWEQENGVNTRPGIK